MKRFLLSLIILATAPLSVLGMQTEDVMIPTEGIGLFGHTTVRLATYIHKPDNFDASKKYPVVIISHGTVVDVYTRTHARFNYAYASEYFLKKGFIVVVPMRRGYAGSDGTYIADNIGSCSNPDYSSSARESSRDIAAVIRYVKGLSFADSRSILLAGISSGGFASLAAASLNIDGVIGAISFAGGQGGLSRTEYQGYACNEQRLVEVMGSFGKSNVPTLWIYSANDAYFRPELAQSMFAEFVRNGGEGTLAIVPPFGHELLSRMEGIDLWAPHCDEYLDELRLQSSVKMADSRIDD